MFAFHSFQFAQWHQERHLEWKWTNFPAPAVSAQMSLWNLLVKKQTRVPNLLMLINTSINFSSTAFKHLNFPPLQLISTRFERKKKKNILFMSIKIYLWKHFQFATYNQSFMIFPRAKQRNKFSSLSFHVRCESKFWQESEFFKAVQDRINE